MRWLNRWRKRVRALVRQEAVDRELDEELAFHLEMAVQKHLRAGLPEEEARRLAGVEFGGVERAKEEVREARKLGWVSGLSLDLKLALRMMRKTPGITAAAGIGMTLAIGIGVGFFIVLHEFLYPELPLDQGERIVALENWNLAENDEWRRQVHDFMAWREEMRSVQLISAFSPAYLELVDGDSRPRTESVAEVTASAFRLARVAPVLGRYLLEEDERPGAQRVLVIGEEVWEDRYERDPNVIGRQVILGDSLHAIVGVMPAGFGFPKDHRFWTPLRVDPSRYPRGEGPEIFVFGRLAPGATREQARGELEAIGRRTAAAFPETHARIRPQLLPYTYPFDDIQNPGFGWQAMASMQSFVSLLLILVAANVAILIYARTAMRRAEIAMRSALGASRKRIVGQLFVEALTLSLISAFAGILLAALAMRAARAAWRWSGTELGFWVRWDVNLPTVLYAIGLALLAAVIVGVVPALQSTGKQLQGDLRRMSGGTGLGLGRVWTALIVGQVALVVGILPFGAAAGANVIAELADRPTYPDEYLRVLLERPAELRPGMTLDEYRRAQSAAFGQRIGELTRALEAEPAVAGVAFTAELPDRSNWIEVEGVPMPEVQPLGHNVSPRGVSPAYLPLLGARVLTGRGLEGMDAGEAANAVVVTRSFARVVLDGGDPVGQRVRFLHPRLGAGDPEREKRPWHEIVGVVEDLDENPLDAARVGAALFYPVAPQQVGGGSVVVRVRGGEPLSFAARMRDVVRAVDPELQIVDMASLVDSRRPLVSVAVAAVTLFVLVLVTLFCSAGIHALMSFSVTRRRREIGIRTALGAGRGRLLVAIFSRAAAQVGSGIALGSLVGGAFLVGEGWVSLPVGLAILLFTATLTALIAAGAAAGPARRGLRIQPMEALRQE